MSQYYYKSELLDLKTEYETEAKGIVLESKIDIGRGPVVNIVVTSGNLKKGDYFVSGKKWGKVRAIINDQGKNIDISRTFNTSRNFRNKWCFKCRR